MSTIEEIAGVHLGKAGDGTAVKPYITPDAVDHKLLVTIPRQLNRTQYGIAGFNLPFVGFDTWHAYEVSFLIDNGYPVSAVAKITYPCNSVSIVESKSLKLYFNSFNMCSMGKTVDEAIREGRRLIEVDLTNALGVPVEVSLHRVDDSYNAGDFINNYDFDLLDNIYGDLTVDEIDFSAYNESADILERDTSNEWSDNKMSVWSPSLRSNCRVTNQPDWGDVYIHMVGKKLPSRASLLQYIVSMRKENHFHEEIAECIYIRLKEKFAPDELFVACLYTRRGGIDINPVRASHLHLLNKAAALRNTSLFSGKSMRQ